jgi:short-subunit dehydrogenase
MLSVDLLDREAVSLIAGATSDLDVGLLIYNAGASTCNEPAGLAGVAPPAPPAGSS